MKYIKLSLMVVFFGSLLPSSVQGQVDQRWLNSWQEANKMKPSNISSVSRITPENEQGKPLIIKGSVFNPDETPAKGVIEHTYHRDAQGDDFGKDDTELKTWRLQGWAKTNKNGKFEFQTIRPAPDYLGREGAHIHFTTISEQYGKQWAPKVFFADDPMITDAQRSRSKAYGKYRWICEVNKANGVQYIEVNIKLKNKQDF